MSEGQRFLSVHSGLTVYLAGCKPLRFLKGEFPYRGNLCTDQQVIETAKRHPDYGKLFITEEDKLIRDAPKPLSQEQTDSLKRAAIKAMGKIPGITAAPLPPAQPVNDGGAIPGSFGTSTFKEPAPVPEHDVKPEPEPPGPALPTLTSVQRMKKDDLFEVADNFNISLEENDTAAIIRRKVKSWIKRNT